MVPTYETPQRGGARRGFGKRVQAASWNEPEDTEFTDSLQPFIALGDATHMALAATWWRLRGEGVRLPAEIGVIVVNGGRL
jgi:hypothetical protein